MKTFLRFALGLSAAVPPFLYGPAQAAPAAASAHAVAPLRCGVITEPLDWNKQDLHGSLVKLDTEICRAVAVALSGLPDRVDLQSYNAEEDGLTAVRQGRADIVVGVTPSALQAAKNGVHFSLPIFEDALGFMVHRAEGVHSLADITGHKLCYIEDTDNDHMVLPYLFSRGIKPLPFGFQEEGEMDAAIMDRHCQVTAAFISKLAEARSGFHNARDYVFLPDLLQLSPVTVAVDGKNTRLSAIVDYTISVLLQAEFLGMTRATAARMTPGEDARLQRLTGADFATAQGLGLAHDWSRQVIGAVGNYAEIYERTVGEGSTFDLGRGLSALWNKGGVMVPLPLD
jgi:general L-amino acid transport system substrate-binding protein